MSQRLGGDVHHDLMPIAAGSFHDAAREEALGNEGEGIRATYAEGNAFL